MSINLNLTNYVIQYLLSIDLLFELHPFSVTVKTKSKFIICIK